VQLLQRAPVPQTRAELEALVNKQGELRAQISSLTERRGRLGQERLNATAREAAGGTQDRAMVQQLTAQIDEMGARLMRLERELAATDDAVLAATSSGVGVGSEIAVGVGGHEPVVVSPPTTFVEVPGHMSPIVQRMQMLMIGEAIAFVLLGFVGWRYLTRRAERRELSAANQMPALGEMRNAIESIAVEVERISENQRYVTKLLADRDAQGSGAAAPRSGKS
jgi:hypothetical protein